MKQDRNGVRTAQDLERKYDLSSIGTLKRNYELQKTSLNKVENELNNFVSVTTQNIEELQNQVDGNITTWFSSGIPTLNNYPANEWDDDDTRNNHLGDLYYDRETGYAYRFTLEENTYQWIDIKDTDVTQALALANAAQDTADSKRRVFVVQPTPPYDVGDLWLKDEELYRCQITKGEKESYAERDWIKATKYTDDTVAYQVDGKLTILSGTVTEIRDDVDELSTTMTNTTKLVDEHGNTIGTLQEQQSSTIQTVNEISSTVSSVSNRVDSQGNTISNLSTKVNGLESDIQGVSADFNDFKDNEYIQSINNLQNQIDGAIQFWNGSNIPTLNNYPASAWTTEQDRINHQADIYTVIQDVSGEMKQGKSYRFDKVNGTWQWIELTDNELSAVQAIAQEALGKANTNASDITTLKSNVSELKQTDTEISARVTSNTNNIGEIQSSIVPTDTSSGSSIYLEDSAEAELIDFEVEGKTEQETTTGVQIFDLNKVNETAVCVRTDTGIKLVNAWASQVLTNANILDTLEPNTTYTCKAIAKITARPTTIQQTQNTLALYRPASSGSLFTVVNTIPNVGTQPLNTEIEIVRTFTTPSDLSNVVLLGYTYYGNNNGSTTYSANGTIELNDLIIVKGTYTSSNFPDYEKYTGKIASPNPDYPSELISVGYENLFKLTQASGTYNELTFTKIDDNTFRVQGTTGSNARSISLTTLFPTLIEGKKYTYSVEVIDGTFVGSIPMAIYNADNTKRYNYFNLYSSITSQTNTIIANNGIFNWDYYIGANSTVDVTLRIMFTKSPIVHTYIPYGKYGVEVKTRGKNLLDKNLFNNFTTALQYINLQLKPNTTYIMSSSLPSYTSYPLYANLFVMNSTDSPNSTTNSIFPNAPRSITTLNDGIVKIAYRDGDNEYSDEKNTYWYQLEEGTQATEYEEYKGKTYLYTLDNPLRSIGDTKDLLYIKNGMLYIERYIRHLELPIADMNNSDAYPGWNNQTQLKIDYPSQNVSFYSLTKWINNINGSKWGLGINTNGNGVLWLYTSAFHLTQTQWKEQYPDLVFKLDYILPEPYTEELGEVQIPSTYKGITHINTTDELEPNMNITYVRDTTLSNYVENQLKSTQIIETRHYAELKLTDESITNRVTSVETNTGTLQSRMDAAETKLDDQSYTIGILGTNIDDDGNITAVRVKEGFTFDENGFQIYTDDNSFKTKIDETGTFYYDGDAIVGQYTKDGSKQKDLELFGVYYYGKSEINQDAMFVAQLYTDENGEECFGHFYNRGD